MAPVVNKDVGVKNITKQQLIDIFTGKTTNWKDVGGKDEKLQSLTVQKEAEHVLLSKNGDLMVKHQLKHKNKIHLVQFVKS